MINVVFVGDTPSPKNVDPTIPFVGANCFERLSMWIKMIDADFYVCLNSDNPEDLRKITLLHNNGFKVITLGLKAASRMPEGIEFFGLPHPSGLNRKINDKKKVLGGLMEAYRYVRK